MNSALVLLTGLTLPAPNDQAPAPEQERRGLILHAEGAFEGYTLFERFAPGRLLDVTREGRVVWDYENPFASHAEARDPDGPPPHAVYRALRVPRDHPGLADRDL